MRSNMKIGVGVMLLAVIVSITIALRARAAKTIQERLPQEQILVAARQLESINGVIPVELLCGPARLTSHDRLENFSCILRNNTNKNLLAANVAYSIIFETGGKEAMDTRLHTIETFIHPDFYEINKPILPGGESTIEPPGPMLYANSFIKRVEVRVEYVEFEDETTLGHNEKGAQIIAKIREGAAKYKNWLTQKYLEKGRSGKAIIPLLQTDQPLPNELGLKDADEQQGARAYRNRLRRIHATRGAVQVEKYLNK